MSSDIVLTKIQVLDLLFRFASVGVLSLLCFFALRQQERTNRFARMSLLVCLMGYLLLTAPVDNHHYGWLRPLLLLLTDTTTYALFAVYWYRVRGVTLFSVMPLWSKLLATAWFTWLCYFFLIEQGRGQFHTFHHIIALCVLGLILLDALRGLSDDLVESRRDTRKLAITLITSYMVFLTTIEVFLTPLKDHWLFSLINVGAIFLLCLFMGYRYVMTGQLPVMRPRDLPAAAVAPPESEQAIALRNTMEGGFYMQNNLTVSTLADEMNMPQHQLRKLINQELGFDNFSQYLNSYRIPAVCDKLEDPSMASVPILTLALEHGFNSIAPFNRAFKDLKNATPTEYRRRFQK